MTRLMFVIVLFLLSGCTMLDQESNFDDAIVNVKHFKNYSKVIGKTYRPSIEAKKGATPTKARLYITVIEKNNDTLQSLSSNIWMELTYLKSFSNYANFTVNNKTYRLINNMPVLESCSDLCINIQQVSLPINNEILIQSVDTGLSFSLSSGNNTIKTDFYIAPGYIRALVEQFKYDKNKNDIENIKPESEVQSMMKYWFEQGTPLQQEDFLKWALFNRNETIKSK